MTWASRDRLAVAACPGASNFSWCEELGTLGPRDLHLPGWKVSKSLDPFAFFRDGDCQIASQLQFLTSWGTSHSVAPWLKLFCLSRKHGSLGRNFGWDELDKQKSNTLTCPPPNQWPQWSLLGMVLLMLSCQEIPPRGRPKKPLGDQDAVTRGSVLFTSLGSSY